MTFVQQIKNFISHNELLTPKARIIVGVSGGSDSVALLDILYHLGYECIVAHCNFHLRGEESFRDEYFVEKLANQYNLKYLVTHFDTKKHVEDAGMSIEMAARELRYAWFEKVRKKHKAEAIAVAHHQDDSVETVLLNLIRGTGIRGLSGMLPKNGKIVRPLLAIYHDDVLEYLKENNIEFVEDSTNAEDIYIRNKIRLNIIPLMETINPSVKQSISRSASNLYQAEQIYLSYIDKASKKVLKDNKVDIDELLKQKQPKTILFELFSPLGFNSSTIDNIFDSIDGQSGKVFYSNSHRIIKDREHLIVEEIPLIAENKIYLITESDTEIAEPVKLKLSTLAKTTDFALPKGSTDLYIDKTKVMFPLVIRKWAHGDWFKPLGMKGSKKLSDYFTDRKFSLPEKENTWLICSGDDIIWIVGERADDRFKITNHTKEIFKIELDNNKIND